MLIRGAIVADLRGLSQLLSARVSLWEVPRNIPAPKPPERHASQDS